MTDKEIYNYIMSDQRFQKFVDEGNYKRLYRLLREIDSSLSFSELTAFFTAAEIDIFEDGVVPTEAFKDNKDLTQFDFSKIKSIESSAFEGSGIKKVVLRNGQTVEQMAFKDSDVEELYLGQNVSIGTGAFARCKNLKELYISATVKLSELAFASCRGLEEVVIDEGRNDFKEDVFANVKHIDYVTLPNDQIASALLMFDNNISIDTLYIIGTRESVIRSRNTTVEGFIEAIQTIRPNIQAVEFTG